MDNQKSDEEIAQTATDIYEQPLLTELGSLLDLTQGSGGTVLTDALGGSTG